MPLTSPPTARATRLRFWVVCLAACMLALGLAACGKKKPKVDPLVASFEVPPAELAKILAQYEKEKAKGPDGLYRSWNAGSFPLRPERGAHRLHWTVEGRVAPAGPTRALLSAVIGEETGPGRLLGCVMKRESADEGAFSATCDTSLFRTDDRPKTMALALGIEQMQAFTPTRLKVDVVSVPVETGWLDWLIAMPLLGLVMFGLWYLFFRRS